MERDDELIPEDQDRTGEEMQSEEPAMATPGEDKIGDESDGFGERIGADDMPARDEGLTDEDRLAGEEV